LRRPLDLIIPKQSKQKHYLKEESLFDIKEIEFYGNFKASFESRVVQLPTQRERINQTTILSKNIYQPFRATHKSQFPMIVSWGTIRDMDFL